MARIHRLSSFCLLFLTIYAMLYFRVVETEYLPHERLVLLPFWVITFLATYVLLDLGSSVLGIEDANDAAVELKKDIADATADLAKKGVKVE